jgi:hypothetical protein
MAIREALQQKPAMALAMGAGLIVIVLSLAAIQFSGGSSGDGGRPDEAYFTTDDGQTWFADGADKLAPFTHDGKEAVRAYVFKCGGKKFVNHLERYTAESVRKLTALNEAMRAGKGVPPVAQLASMREVEVKKPGAAEWVSTKSAAKAAGVVRVVCPDGAKGEATAVAP